MKIESGILNDYPLATQQNQNFSSDKNNTYLLDTM